MTFLVELTLHEITKLECCCIKHNHLQENTVLHECIIEMIETHEYNVFAANCLDSFFKCSRFSYLLQVIVRCPSVVYKSTVNSSI